MKGLPEKIYIGACIALVAVSVINAIDYGVGGKYKDMHSSINWALWIGNTIVLMVLLRRRDEEIEVKDSYIKALEDYKDLIEAHKTRSEGLEEQIENYKKLIEVNDKIFEEYKNQKPSRF
jgi:hypothetical protein